MDNRQLRLHTLEDILEQPPVEWLVENILPQKSEAMLYGAPGCGKSFVAIDLGFCVAAGSPWLGQYAINAGPVFYMANEGRHGLRTRAHAWLHHRETDTRPFVDNWFCPAETVNLMDADCVARFTAAAHAVLAGRDAALVIVDTLSRSMRGGDENSSRDMGIVFGSVDTIRERLGCAVLVLHHTGHGGGRARGSSVIGGDADMIFGCSQTGAVITLTCEKSKETEQPDPITLRRLVVDLGDETSCVIEPDGESEAQCSWAEQRIIELATMNPQGMSRLEYQNALVPTEMGKGTFDRAIRRLYQRGEMTKTGRGKQTKWFVSDTYTSSGND